MRGHVHKRGRTWAYVVDVGRDPVTGRRKQSTKGGFRTRKEAERALAESISQLGHGTFVEPTRQTVADYLRDWLKTGETRGLRESTRVGYDVVVEKYVVPKLGVVALQKLTAAQLNGLYGELLQSGRRQREGGLRPRTVRYVHTVMRKALADAVRWGLLARNVADAADPPSASAANADARRARNAWSLAELRRFLAVASSHRLFAAFRLAAMTGMRRGEVLGLRWQDVDLDGGRLSVRQTLIAPRYKLQLSAPKNGEPRGIDLDPETVTVLRAHRRRQSEERLAFGPGWGEHPLANDFVFRQEDGSPVVPHLFSLAFERLTKKAGLRRIRLHDLRHTHAVLLAKSGAHPKVVQERLGHHSPGFTLDVYNDAFPSQQREAAEGFAALVSTERS